MAEYYKHTLSGNIVRVTGDHGFATYVTESHPLEGMPPPPSVNTVRGSKYWRQIDDPTCPTPSAPPAREDLVLTWPGGCGVHRTPCRQCVARYQREIESLTTRLAAAEDERDDAKLMLQSTVEGLEAAEAERDRLLHECDDLHCSIASAFGWELKGKTFAVAVRETVAEAEMLRRSYGTEASARANAEARVRTLEEAWTLLEWVGRNCGTPRYEARGESLWRVAGCDTNGDDFEFKRPTLVACLKEAQAWTKSQAPARTQTARRERRYESES